MIQNLLLMAWWGNASGSSGSSGSSLLSMMTLRSWSLHDMLEILFISYLLQRSRNSSQSGKIRHHNSNHQMERFIKVFCISVLFHVFNLAFHQRRWWYQEIFPIYSLWLAHKRVVSWHIMDLALWSQMKVSCLVFQWNLLHVPRRDLLCHILF